MNRVEYMMKLAALLQDVPAEERREAMKYYNDYFDEAGEENEEAVAGELDSPEQVAAAIKAELFGSGGAGEAGEYRETGYTDTRFERKESPAAQESREKERAASSANKWLKLLLMIAAVVVGVLIAGGVVIPLAVSVLAVVFCGFIVLGIGVVMAVIIVFVGMILFVIGLIKIPVAAAAALVLMGAGLLLFAFGMMMTVLLVKLCIVLFPAMVRMLVNFCRKIFHRSKKEKDGEVSE